MKEVAERGCAAMEILIGLLESARLGEVVRLPVAQMAYPLDLVTQRPKSSPRVDVRAGRQE